jgi:hypothetical protein
MLVCAEAGNTPTEKAEKAMRSRRMRAGGIDRPRWTFMNRKKNRRKRRTSPDAMLHTPCHTNDQ